MQLIFYTLLKKKTYMNFKMIAAGVAALLLSCSVSAEEWKAAGDAIKTKWAEKVDPSAPLPEYPRPQMVRSQWVRLREVRL